jgi:hypothetical protein
MSFGTGLYSVLAADSTIQSLVADAGASPATYRIFPSGGGENPTMPCLIYSRISATRDLDFDGPDYWVKTRVQIDCLADTYDAAAALAEAVRGALDGYSGSFGSLTCAYARLDNGPRDLIEEAAAFNRAVMDFIITHTES